MSWFEFLVIFILCISTMFLCRTIPLLFLKGRELPKQVTKALTLIPPATFAALVANDVLDPDMFVSGLWPGCAILIAAVCVIAVALFTKSLLWSAIGGVISYAILLYWETPVIYIASIFQ